MGWFDNVIDSISKAIEKSTSSAPKNSAKSNIKSSNSQSRDFFAPPTRAMEKATQEREQFIPPPKAGPRLVELEPRQATEMPSVSEPQPKVEAKPVQIDQGPQVDPGQVQQAKQAKVDAAAAERRERDRILGIKPGEKVKDADLSDPNQTYVMSDAVYNALNEDQRAGVDADTILVEALRTDNVDKELKARLKQLGLDSRKSTLSGYTSLRATVNDDDIKNILSDEAQAKTAEAYLEQGLSALAPIQSMIRQPNLDPTLGNKRFGLVTELVGAAKELTEKFRKQGTLLAGFDIAAAADRGEKVESASGGSDENDALIAGLVGTKIPGFNKKDFLANLAANRNAPDVQAFLKYADAKSQNAINYDEPLGTGKKLLKPEDFRKLLGLEQRGEDDGVDANASK